MNKILYVVIAFLITAQAYCLDPYAAEFKEMGYKIKKMLDSKTLVVADELKAINGYRYMMALEFTEITVRKKELRDKFNHIKCALNFPSENRIEINRKCWEKVRQDLTLAFPFVLHEYLGITGEEIDSYEVSKHMYQLSKDFLEELDNSRSLREETAKKRKEEVRTLQINKLSSRISDLSSEEVNITYERLTQYPTLREIRAFKVAEVLRAFDFEKTRTITFSKETGEYVCDRIGFNSYLGCQKGKDLTEDIYILGKDGMSLVLSRAMVMHNVADTIYCGNK